MLEIKFVKISRMQKEIGNEMPGYCQTLPSSFLLLSNVGHAFIFPRNFTISGKNINQSGLCPSIFCYFSRGEGISLPTVYTTHIIRSQSTMLENLCQKIFGCTEIQTQHCGVKSVIATSVLCSLHRLTLTDQLVHNSHNQNNQAS